VQRRNAGEQLRGVLRSEARGRRRPEGVATLHGGSTRRSRSPRGARIDRGLNSHDQHRTQRGEQGPEGEGAQAGAGQTAGGCVQRHEGMIRRGKPRTAPR